MKKLLFALAALVVMAVPAGVFAAEQTTPPAIDRATECPAYVWNNQELTEEQRAAMQESYESRQEVRKEIIGNLVTDGQITQEEADQALERSEQRQQLRLENGCGLGDGTGMMNGEGKGFGRGMMNGGGNGGNGAGNGFQNQN